MIKGEYKGDCGAASYGDAIAAYGWQRRLSQAQCHVLNVTIVMEIEWIIRSFMVLTNRVL